MPSISQIADFLEAFAPQRLAEDWDNVGLLVGDPARPVARLMTCLTVTPESAREAIERRADLVVSHHPLPFRPLKRLTTQATPGRLLLSLAENRIAVYSPHTAFDSAAEGINEQLAAGIGLTKLAPLTPLADDPQSLGAGRVGVFDEPLSLAAAIDRVKRFVKVDRVQAVGEGAAIICRAAVGCGSGGSFWEPASKAGCELLVTGETNFHTCLEAIAALGMSLILPGHYASERFAVETLAQTIERRFPDLDVWASKEESDPLFWM